MKESILSKQQKRKYSILHFVTEQDFVEAFISKWGEDYFQQLILLLSSEKIHSRHMEDYRNLFKIVCELKIPCSATRGTDDDGSWFEFKVFWSQEFSIKRQF